MARALYEGTFNWLIKQLNEAVKLPEGMDTESTRWVGLLDIFGFEVMPTNSLEQLFINYANEKLQQYFIINFFRAEEDLYREEGIDISGVTFGDNVEVIKVIDGKGQGILQLLEDQSKLSGTDAKFLDSVNRNAAAYDKIYKKGQNRDADTTFTIVHSMASVTYSIEGFVSKNREALEAAQVKCLHKSDVRLLKEIFPKAAVTKAQEAQTYFTATSFRESIDQLLKTLKGTEQYPTESFFLRCLKPNITKLPNNFEFSVTAKQLKSLSVLDALRLAQSGYPTRDTFADFLKHFMPVVLVHHPATKDDHAEPKAKADTLMKKLIVRTKNDKRLEDGDKIVEGDYQMGKTQLFLKKMASRCLDDMRRRICTAGQEVNSDIMRLLEAKRQRLEYTLNSERAVRIQAFARQFHLMRQATARDRLKRRLWGAILLSFRYRRFKRDRLAAFTIQTTIRELAAMVRMHDLKKKKRLADSQAATSIYLQVMLAQKELQARIAEKHRHRLISAVERTTELWMQRRSLKRFWTWRAAAQSAKRLYAHRMRLLSKVQALVKGMLDRRSPKGQKVRAAVEECRRRRFKEKTTYTLQKHIKGWLKDSRFSQLQEATRTFQFYMRRRRDLSRFERYCDAAKLIQKNWRGWLTRTLLFWKKLQVLRKAELAAVGKSNARQRSRLVRLCDYGGVKPLTLVELDVKMDVSPFYPDGWVSDYEACLKREGGNGLVKLAVGAEHSVALGKNGLYAWGSDEVGQLGLGEQLTRKPVRGPVPFRLMQPKLKIPVVDVACGRWHTLASVDGPQPLYVWGLNHRGQCGIKTYETSPAGMKLGTMTYPRMVRTPSPSTVKGPILDITCGPFTSACLAGVPSKLYLWGEGSGCGREDDVRIPMPVELEYPVQRVVLGEQFVLALHEKGLCGWGTECPQLGNGKFPLASQESEGWGRFCKKVAPMVRFDQHTIVKAAKLVDRPAMVKFPLRQPRFIVEAIALGEEHVVVLTNTNEVYEWGVRHLLRDEPPETDMGLVYVAKPMYVSLDRFGRAEQIRAAGDVTSVLLGSHEGGQHMGWSFVQTTSAQPGSKPGQAVAEPHFVACGFSYRLLRPAIGPTRLEMAGSASMHAVLGYTAAWAEPPMKPRAGGAEKGDLLVRERSPRSGRGTRQPFSSSGRESSPRKRDASPRPVRTCMGTPPVGKPGVKFAPGRRAPTAATARTPVKTPAGPEPVLSKPQFTSPSHRGGDKIKLAGPAVDSPRRAQSPGASGVADLVAGHGGRAKTMFELQNLLGERSQEDLLALVKQLKSPS